MRKLLMLIPFMLGCSGDVQQPAPTINRAVLESAATPEMVADLHKREAEYFARNRSNAIVDPTSTKIPLVWERLEMPINDNSHWRGIWRTEIPEGWLIFAQTGGDRPAFATVCDPEHRWRTSR